MIEIDASEARRLRARAQLLGGSRLSPAEAVARAGAMQGQELGAVLRAIALRSAAGTTVDEVRAAFDAGELVRGWPMRGTLFAVAPADLAGLVRATGPGLRSSLRRRRDFLGLSEADFERAKAVAIEALDRRPHSREELGALWVEAGVPQEPGMNYHFVSTLSIDGVLRLGRFDGKEQLVERALPSAEDETAFLVRIARAFLLGRGPAAIEDLAWWTKLPKGLLGRVVAEVEGLERLRVDGRELLHVDDRPDAPEPPQAVLVPAFDEWILGYRDRSLTASEAALRAIATVNGIFRPTILLDGVAVGTWSAAKGRAAVAQLVEPVSAAEREAIEAALAAWPHG